MAHATHRFTDRAEARLIAVRARLSEAGQAKQDEPGVVGGKQVVSEPPFFQRPGTKVLDDDVGVAREPAGDLLPFRHAQIGGHRFFVARLHVPPQRRAIVQQSPLAQRIAARVLA